MQPTRKENAPSNELLKKYLETRGHTESLCEPLEVEDYVPQPVEDVSPVKWNIAHTSWFFEEMVLKRFVPEYPEFDPAYRYLFNSYYNTVGERTLRHKRGDLSRPTVREVFSYRKRVDEHMSAFLGGDVPQGAADLITLGINHEQQHQELLLADLKLTLSLNPLNIMYRDGFSLVEKGPVRESDYISVPEGSYQIGFAGGGFCFDNELGRHDIILNGFEISRGLVTNGDFLEFIGDGGYETPLLWHSEGWDWVTGNGINAPLYWNKSDGEWHQYTLGGRHKVDPAHAVCHVSFYEAAAFAVWKGCRLPTEFEWEAANVLFDWGLRWEWTNSAYLPYPGFSIADGAVGEYNGKFMVNQMVLRGASVATPDGHSRGSYRNFFHPQLRWQFTGFRLAR